MTSAEGPAAVEKLDRMFRQHDQAPQGVVSHLYRHLTQEWADLHATPSTATKVRRWGRIEPSMAGFTRPGDVIDAIDKAANESKNELLLALIRLFQAGHQLAGRTVLQALLPKLATTSAHASSLCTSSTNTWAEDRRHITIAEFWDVMATYPVERRTTSVASNLALDTLRRVTAMRRPVEDIPVDPHDLRDLDELGVRDTARRTWLASLSNQDPDLTSDLTAEADLLQVIAWGMTTTAITRDEAQLLVLSYLPEKTTGFGFDDAAVHLGLTPAAIRQRCSRVARKLTEAVRAEMRAPAEPSSTPAIRVA